VIYETDQELITRFRHLTGKRPLGGFTAMVLRDFDWDGGTLRSYFEHHEWLSGWSLGEAESICTAWGRHRDGAGYTAPPSPRPAPMWWDGDLDPNMRIIEDRTKKCDRLYRPQYWEGVFDDGVKPPINDGLTDWQREQLEAFWAEKKKHQFDRGWWDRHRWWLPLPAAIANAPRVLPKVQSISACPKCNEEMEWKPDMQWRSKANHSQWNEGGVFYCEPCDAFFVPMID